MAVHCKHSNGMHRCIYLYVNILVRIGQFVNSSSQCLPTDKHGLVSDRNSVQHEPSFIANLAGLGRQSATRKSGEGLYATSSVRAMSDDEAANEEYRLDRLNDYCLLNIINFLDLKSKLTLHLTCKKLNHLISDWFAKQKFFGDRSYSTVDLCTNRSHRLDEYQYSLRSLTESCSDSGWNLSILLLNRLFQLSDRLECLHFNCLDDESSVNERLLLSVLGLPRLTCLSFGVGLQVSAKNWSLIISQFGNQLQHLQINRVNYLTLENIVKHCPNLVSLHVRHCPSSIGCLAYLWPKLRRLRIQSMATIYLRNALFSDRFRQVGNAFENEENPNDENTINLIENDSNENTNNNPGDNASHPIINTNNPISKTESHLNRLDGVWYWNLIELRLNRVTVRSMTVLFNHCINLQVLDIVLFFNRASIVFENQVR